MPVYDYKCREHGHFYQLAKLEDAAEPAACPTCGTLSARVIVLPPHLRGLERKSAHAARERNERSQHEPVYSTPDRRAEENDRHAHAARKGCGDHHDKRKSKLFYTADGKKMFPSMRPWMISH